MTFTPWTVLALAFAMLLVLNIFIRVKVLILYRTLVNNEIDFQSYHFFNTDCLKSEVLPLYPEHSSDILKFVRLVRFSMTMASAILVLIIVFGYMLFNS